MAVRNNLKGYEGQRFVRRKAVLMQLSKVIDEMEERLFFLETKHDIEIYVGKGKHDYTPLETAQAEALEAFKTGNFDALEGPMAVWTEWATKTDFTNKKAMVTKKVATGLNLNLAVCHLYRDEYVEVRPSHFHGTRTRRGRRRNARQVRRTARPFDEASPLVGGQPRLCHAFEGRSGTRKGARLQERRRQAFAEQRRRHDLARRPLPRNGRHARQVAV